MQNLKFKITSALFVLLALLQTLGCFRNYHLLTIGGIYTPTLLFVFVIILCLTRIFGKYTLSEKVAKISMFVIGPLILTLACILSLVNFQNGPNYIYSKTFLNIEQLFLLGVFIQICGVICQSDIFFKKFYKRILFFSGLSFLVLFYFFTLLPFNSAGLVVREDQIIENLQFIALLVGSLFSASVGLRLFKKHIFFAFLFITLSVLLLLITGDEISWGQRILNITTPAYLTSSNAQNEITLHNQRYIEGIVPFGYTVIGFLGSIGWIIYEATFLKKYKLLTLVIPGLFLFPYFASTFLYNLITILTTHSIGVWAEVVELMLYAGITFHLIICSKVILRKLPKHT